MPKTYDGVTRRLSSEESSSGSGDFKTDPNKIKTTKSTRKKLVEPDGGWGWAVVIGVAISNMCSQSLVSVYGLLFVERLLELNIDTKGAAAIFSVQMTSISISGFITGPLIKKFTYRGAALIGSSLVCGGLLLTTYVNELFGFIFTYSLFTGVGLGLLVSSTFIAIDAYFKKHKGLAVSLSLVGTSLGQVWMPFLVKFLLTEFGFKSTMLILAAIASHSFIGVTLYDPVKWHMKVQEVNEEEENLINHKTSVPNLKNPTEASKPIPDNKTDEEAEYKEINKNEEKKDEEEEEKKKGTWSKIVRAMDWDLLKDLSFLNLVISIAVVYSSNMLFQLLYPFFLQSIGFPLSDVAICMSVLSGADIVGRLIVHVFTDTFKMKSKTVLFMGAGLSGIARSALATQSDFIVILVLASCAGIVRAAIVCNLPLSISQQVKKEKLPAAVGIGMVFKGIATMSFGPLIGFIRDYTQSYSLSIHIVSVFFLGLPFLSWLVEWILTNRRMKR